MNDESEKRKEKRFGSDTLPDSLQYCNIQIGPVEISVKILDASFKGMGIITLLPVNKFVPRTAIYLFPLGKSMKITGQIAYAVDTDGKTRVGIEFHDSENLEKYQKYLLETIRENLDNL